MLGFEVFDIDERYCIKASNRQKAKIKSKYKNKRQRVKKQTNKSAKL